MSRASHRVRPAAHRIPARCPWIPVLRRTAARCAAPGARACSRGPIHFSADPVSRSPNRPAAPSRGRMTIQSDYDTLVTVFGGSGFIGRHVVRALAKRHYRIRVAVRRPELAGHLQPLGRVGQIHAVQANVRHAGSGRGRGTAMRRRRTWSASSTSAAASASTRCSARAPRRSRARRRCMARGWCTCRRSAPMRIPGSLYARTKAAGEQAALAAVPAATIIRPSIVFGPEDHFFNKFASLARFMPALPLIGGGKTRFQPVFAGDVGSAVAAAVAGETTPGATYELGGTEVLSFRDLMRFVLATIDRRRLLLPIPFGLAKLQATLLQLLPGPPLLTRDQVELLKRDSVVADDAKADGRTLGGLGIEPTSMQAIVPSYLWRFRPAGQFQRLRAE